MLQIHFDRTNTINDIQTIIISGTDLDTVQREFNAACMRRACEQMLPINDFNLQFFTNPTTSKSTWIATQQWANLAYRATTVR